MAGEIASGVTGEMAGEGITDEIAEGVAAAADPEPGPCVTCGDTGTYWDGMVTFACTSCGHEWGIEEAISPADEVSGEVAGEIAGETTASARTLTLTLAPTLTLTLTR